MKLASVRIDPEAWYDSTGLYELLGLSPGSIDQARYRKELRFTRRAGRILMKGSWVEAWLTNEPIERREAQAVPAA
jgi:hypothetical protein